MNQNIEGQLKKGMTAERVELTDRAQISELLSRYCGAVDDKCISVELVASIFTPEGRYVAPNGAAVVGPEAISADKSKVFDRFRATQHITSDHIIELDVDTAKLRANMTAMHLWAEKEIDPLSLQTHFVAGGVFEGVAVRSSVGWRFSELSSRITWRTGAGLPMMAMIGSPNT